MAEVMKIEILKKFMDFGLATLGMRLLRNIRMSPNL